MTHAELKKKLPRGALIYDRIGPAKVMANEDGYLMVRRSGLMPFIVKASDVDSERYARWKTKEHA